MSEEKRMNTKQLIEKLSYLPPEAVVGYVWDGEVRSIVEYVWLARDGSVVLSDGEVPYSTDSRPKGSKTEAEL